MKKVNCIKLGMILFVSSVLNSYANTEVSLRPSLSEETGFTVKS